MKTAPDNITVGMTLLVRGPHQAAAHLEEICGIRETGAHCSSAGFVPWSGSLFASIGLHGEPMELLWDGRELAAEQARRAAEAAKAANPYLVPNGGMFRHYYQELVEIIRNGAPETFAEAHAEAVERAGCGPKIRSAHKYCTENGWPLPAFDRAAHTTNRYTRRANGELFADAATAMQPKKETTMTTKPKTTETATCALEGCGNPAKPGKTYCSKQCGGRANFAKGRAAKAAKKAAAAAAQQPPCTPPAAAPQPPCTPAASPVRTPHHSFADRHAEPDGGEIREADLEMLADGIEELLADLRGGLAAIRLARRLIAVMEAEEAV